MDFSCKIFQDKIIEISENNLTNINNINKIAIGLNRNGSNINITRRAKCAHLCGNSIKKVT